MIGTMIVAAALNASTAAAVVSVQPAAAPAVQTNAGTLTFYDNKNYTGEGRGVREATRRWTRLDNPIRSIAVHPGDRWEICAEERFERCVVIDQSVPDAAAIGIVDQIGSVRPAPKG